MSAAVCEPCARLFLRHLRWRCRSAGPGAGLPRAESSRATLQAVILLRRPENSPPHRRWSIAGRPYAGDALVELSFPSV